MNLFFPARQGFLCDNLLVLGRLCDFSLVRWFVAFPVYMVLPAHFDQSYSKKSLFGTPLTFFFDSPGCHHNLKRILCDGIIMCLLVGE